MTQSVEPLIEPTVKKTVSANETQRRILLAGAILAVVLLLFPPWSFSGGASGGFHFIFAPPRPSAHVNSSLLFLQLMALALMAWFLFFAAKNSTAHPIGKLTILIIISVVVVALMVFAWFVWPKGFIEADGFRTTRFTGTRYVWNEKKGWITEADQKADDVAQETQQRNKAKPVLDDLTRVTVESGEGAADHLIIYNPTHWMLPSSDSKLTVEYYRQTKTGRVLLKISEHYLDIQPGMNDIYLYDAHHFVGREPLLEIMKITANLAKGIGSETSQFKLLPAFQFDHQRICQTEYTKIQRDPLTENSEDDPYLDEYTSKVVCRRQN